MRLPAAFSPLATPTFRVFWIAQLASSLGTWMQNTGAGWLMTDLSNSPTMVALVHVASLAPVFVLAPIAGALADMVDNRKLLSVTMAWMFAAALLLAVLTHFGLTGPWGLLALTFAIGIGMAMAGPSWQSLVPDLVPRKELAPAIALNGMAFNGARAVGPALAGVLVAAVGTAACFGANALSYAVVLALLPLIRTATPPSSTGNIAAAIRDGVRFARASVALKAVLARDLLYFAAAAPIFALLPLVARGELGAGPQGFGLLLAAMGVGAVTAGFVLPRLRAWASFDRLLMLSTLGTALGLAGLALAPVLEVGMAAIFVFGASWLTGNSCLQVVLQTSLPTWVRARAISFHQVALNFALAAAGLLWGWLAEGLGVRATLGLGALVAVAAALLGRLRPLLPAAPAESEIAPRQVPMAVAPEAAPILLGGLSAVFVTSAWSVPLDRRPAFMALMEEVGRLRRAAGASGWTLAEDIGAPENWIEVFMADGWAEYERIVGRTSVALASLLERAAGLASSPPETRIWVSPGARR
jgi:MFS family permease/branched-subunit amino acid transport protein